MRVFTGSSLVVAPKMIQPLDSVLLVPLLFVVLFLSTTACGQPTPQPPAEAGAVSAAGDYAVNSTHAHLRTEDSSPTPLIIRKDGAVLSVTVALCSSGVRGADGMSVDLTNITFAGANATVAVVFLNDGTCGAEVAESMSVDVTLSNIDLTNDGLLVITGNMTHSTKLSILGTRVVASGYTHKLPTVNALVPGGNPDTGFADVAMALFIGGGGSGMRGSTMKGTVLIEDSVFTGQQNVRRSTIGVAILNLREIAMRGPGSGFVMRNTNILGQYYAFLVSRIASISFEDHSIFLQRNCTITATRSTAFIIHNVSSITFGSYSVFVQDKCTFTTAGSGGAGFRITRVDNITFADHSVFSQQHCTATSATDHAFHIEYVKSVIFRNHSAFNQDHCIITSSRGSSFVFEKVSSITFGDHSLFSQRHCAMTSNLGHAFVVTEVNIMRFGDHSTFSQLHSTMISASSHAVLLAVNHFVFTGGSTMAIADSTLESRSAKEHTPICIWFRSYRYISELLRIELGFYNASLFLLRNVLFTCSSCKRNGGVWLPLRNWEGTISGGTLVVDTSSMVHADNVTANRMPIFLFDNVGGLEFATADTTSRNASTTATNFVVANSFAPDKHPGFVRMGSYAQIRPASPPSPLIYFSCLHFYVPAAQGALVTILSSCVSTKWISVAYLINSSCGVCGVSTACFAPNTLSLAASTDQCGCQCASPMGGEEGPFHNTPPATTASGGVWAVVVNVSSPTIPCGPQIDFQFTGEYSFFNSRSTNRQPDQMLSRTESRSLPGPFSESLNKTSSIIISSSLSSSGDGATPTNDVMHPTVTSTILASDSKTFPPTRTRALPPAEDEAPVETKRTIYARVETGFVSTAVVASTVTGGSGGVAVAETQALLLVLGGLSRCSSDQTLRAAADGGKKVLAPLAIGDGPFATTSGILLILFLFAVANAAIALWFGRLMQRKPGRSSTGDASGAAPPPPPAVLGMAAARFPALTITLYTVAYAGLSQSAAAGLAASESRGTGVAVVVLLCVAPPCVMWALLRFKLSAEAEFFPFSALGPLQSFPAPVRALFLPSGYWDGSAAHVMFRPLFSSLRGDVRRWHWVFLLGYVRLFVTALLSSGIVSDCDTQTGVLVGINVVMALLLVLVRPYRAGLSNVAGALLSVLSCGCIGAVKMERYSEAMTIVAAASVLSLVALLASLGITWRQRKWVREEKAAHSSDGGSGGGGGGGMLQMSFLRGGGDDDDDAKGGRRHNPL